MSTARAGQIAAASDATGFPRAARLTRKPDFDRVLRAPTRCGSMLFRAQVAPGEGPDGARLGLAIAKRVVRKSHDRNRLKRHVREVFRTRRTGLPHADIVVFAKSEALAATPQALRQDLSRLFDRVAALNLMPRDGTMPSAAPTQEIA